MNFGGEAERQQQQPTLEQLDAWCSQALSSASAAERSEAERRLRYYFPTFSETQAEVAESHGFSAGQARVMAVFHSIKGPGDAGKLMSWFLHQTWQVFSITYIVNRLRTLVLNHLNVMSTEQKTELRNSLFAAIREKSADMPGFLIYDMARTLALVVMFTWFEVEDSKDVVDSILDMAGTSAANEVLGLQMMRAFVEEFNKELAAKYMSKQRRVVVTFRDRQLKSIYEHALAAMRAGLEGEDSEEGRMVVSQALLLQRECLGFDFIGLAADEASDEAVAIQIPSTWKDVIQVDGFLDAFFEGYRRSAPPLSSQFIEVLVLVASLRRSFYMESVRVAFVTRMAAGVAEILAGGVGLDDVENYHHVCRLLARFRSIHTLVEIEETAVHRRLLEAVAAFSVTGLRLWAWSANSVAPLLTFWARVAATHDGRDAERAAAGDVVAAALPRIVGEYVRAMMQASADDAAADGPLDDEDALLEAMALAGGIARAAYGPCVAVILDLLRGDHEAAQLACAVYAAAACIGARQPYKATGDDDRRDADLFAAGLGLLGHVAASEALELSFLQLLGAFRAAYAADASHGAAAALARLGERVGLRDGAGVADVVVARLLFNLRTWDPASRVTRRSLQLFHDATAGYVGVRQVARLGSAAALLENHASPELRFVRGLDEYKPRALYYAGVARLLLAGEPSRAQFDAFARPWAAAAEALLADESDAAALLRLLRDWRGFLAAVAAKRGFALFFAWLGAAHRMDVVHRAVVARDARVQVAALKFLAEFVYNRTQRLSFDVAAATGVLMFRDASRALWAYGSAVLAAAREPVRDEYKERLKGVSVCFTVLTRLVAGKYVALGVMPLYGDDALDRALRMALALLQLVPPRDAIAYPKVGRAATALLDVLLARPLVGLVPLDAAAYEHAMRVCVEAFDHADAAVSSSACSVVDAALTAAIQSDDDDDAGVVGALVRDRPDITCFLLRAVLNIVLFEDRPNDWSFSRPLFCLIVLDSAFALQYTSQIVQYQPPERRADLIKALKDLLSSTEFVLSTVNRDRFTQALTQYRREVSSKNLILMVPTDQTMGESVDILAGKPGGEGELGKDGSGENEASMAE